MEVGDIHRAEFTTAGISNLTRFFLDPKPWVESSPFTSRASTPHPRQHTQMAKPPPHIPLFFGGLHWDTIPLA